MDGTCCEKHARVISVLMLCAHFWIRNTFGFNINTNNPDIYQENPGSNFGFSVAQYTINDTKWIMVGAPHDINESPDVTEPSRDGSVYRCRQGSCFTVPFDTELPTDMFMTEGFLGGALAVETDGMFVACAPRSRYHKPGDAFEKEELYMTGACFLYDGATDTYLPPYTPCAPGTHGITPDRFGCAAGFSVAPGQHRTSFIFGGLGSGDYAGEFIRMEIESRRYPDYGSRGEEKYGYLGYAVVTGRFSGRDEPDVVAGSPRGKEHLGEVEIFQRRLDAYGGWLRIGKPRYGQQVGSYFGSVLSAGDLNGDGLDDLVIGAPFFANTHNKQSNVGRVYIYYQLQPSTRPANVIFDQQYTVLEGDVHTSGLFGSSLAVLSDINQDGYQDLAVGCPLGGRTGQGTVSIYLGSTAGLLTARSQHIEASDISTDLFGFGSAVTGNVDMDNNGYPDIVIGAPWNSSVVLLRTHPVLRVAADITVEPNQIELEKLQCDVPLPADAKNCINATTEIMFDGVQVPRQIDLLFTWSFDVTNTTDTLVFFGAGPGKKAATVSTTETLIRGQKIIKEHTIFFTREVVSYMKPIGVVVTFDLLSPPISVSDSVLDQSAPSHDIAQMDVFRPPADLNITVNSTSSRVALSAGEIIELYVEVENTASVPCYRVDLVVDSHAGITYSNIDSPNSVTCYLFGDGGTRTICNLGFVFTAESKIGFLLHMSVETPKLLLNSSTIDFAFNVTSANDVNPANDFAEIILDVETDSRIQITGNSEPDQVVMTGTEQNVTHTIQLSNVGKSPLNSAEVWIRWPVATPGGVPLLSSPRGPVFKDDRGRCHRDEHRLAPLGITELEPCDDEKSTEMCILFHCSIEYIEEDEIISIAITGTILPNIMDLSDIDNTITLESKVKVIAQPLIDLPSGGGPATDETEVMTKIVFPDVKRQGEKVATWIIVVSIVAGVLFLAIIIGIFWKLGFFKREMRDDLYTAKRTSVNDTWTSHSRLGSAGDEGDEADDESSSPPTEKYKMLDQTNNGFHS